MPGIAAILNYFHEQTKEVVSAIPAETDTPAFMNRSIGLRYQLGHTASQLAIDIAEDFAVEESLAELQGLPVTPDRT